jgi:hypothetical protein
MTAVEHERGASHDRSGAASRVIPFPLAAVRQPASPELALVDPDLRDRLLATLHDPGLFLPASRVARPAADAGPVAPVIRLDAVAASPAEQPAGGRRRLAVALALAAGACVMAGFAIARYAPGSDAGDAALQQTTSAPSSAPTAATSGPHTGSPSASPPPAKPKATTSTTPRPRPAAPASPRTATPTPPTSGRTFAWAPAQGTEVYDVQFFRGAQRVYAGRVRGTRLELPASWRQRGARQSLTPGSYRWYVWAVQQGQRARQPVVQATFVVDRPS